jgi:hypothetical protein
MTLISRLQSSPVGGSRWRLLALVAAGVAVTPTCSNERLDAPSVTSEKWETDRGCFAISSGSWQNMPSDCPQNFPHGTMDLSGGSDVVRLVINYGYARFAASQAPPTPTVTLALDGVVSPSNATVNQYVNQSQPSSTYTPAIFLATFTAPPRNVTSMYVYVTAGQGFTSTPVGPFIVQAPPVQVSFPQCATFDSAGCASDGVVAVQVTAPAALGTTATLQWAFDDVPQPTAPTAAVMLNLADLTVSGIDGDASFDPPVTMVTGVAYLAVPLVNPQLQLDGGYQTDNMTPNYPGADASFDGGLFRGVPYQPNWSVVAQVGSYVGVQPFAGALPPAVSLSLQCEFSASSIPCELTAGTGSALVTVTALQAAGSTANLIWSYDAAVVDGGQVDGPLSTMAMAVPLSALGPSSQMMSATVAVPTPSGPFGAGWTLQAVVGAYSATSGAISLQYPGITVTFDECSNGTGCQFASGVGTTPITITAPATPTTTATLTWSLNGVPQQQFTPEVDGGSGSPIFGEAGPGPALATDGGVAAPISVPLTGIEYGAASYALAATVLVPVPTAPAGTIWQVEAQVGEYVSVASATIGPGPTPPVPFPTITPATAVSTENKLIQFSAVGGAGPPFAWSKVNAGTVSPSQIDQATGLYQAGMNSAVCLAPSACWTDTIIVTDRAGNPGTAAVTIYSPLSATLPPGTSLQTCGSVQLGADGGSGGYTWSYPVGGNNTLGMLSASGTYTAGAVANTDIVALEDSAGNGAELTISVAAGGCP